MQAQGLPKSIRRQPADSQWSVFAVAGRAGVPSALT